MTVESVLPDAVGVVPARDWQQGCEPGQRTMERGVEACDLPQLRMSLAQRLDQPDLQRQVLGHECHDAAEFLQQASIDARRCVARHAVHEPMPDRMHAFELRLRLKPVEQQLDRGVRVLVVHAGAVVRCPGLVGELQARPLADAVDLAAEHPPQRIAAFE